MMMTMMIRDDDVYTVIFVRVIIRLIRLTRRFEFVRGVDAVHELVVLESFLFERQLEHLDTTDEIVF